MGQSGTKARKQDPAPSSSSVDDVVVEVCSITDMKDGEMREVELMTTKALLVKSGDSFYCVGNKCTHLSGPLSKGVVCKGKVRCPLHGACFDLATGDIEEFPGLDGIPTFKVEIVNYMVRVRANRSNLVSKKVKAMVSGCSAEDSRVFLIVGGGPASVTCAESLRQEGYNGRVVVAMMESHLPYDRTKLSKAMTTTPDDIALRNNEFYEKYGIEICINKQVESVNFDKKVANYVDRTDQSYDKIMLATGSKPITLSLPGVELGNVFTLRSVVDANSISAQAKDKDVVIIGSSFVGMELAMYFSDKTRSVTVIVRGDAPFINSLGQQVGLALLKLHESKGVKFALNAHVCELQGEAGVVSGVKLGDGTVLPCNVCVQAVGVVPATDFLKDSGIAMTDQGYIIVDKHMKTNLADVYAGGDSVQFPLGTDGDRRVSIGHWQMAHQHGRVAAYNMLDRDWPLHSVPYFWTVAYGKSVRFAGYNHGFDDIIIHGELDNLKYVAFYTKGDKVVAASSMNFDPVVSQLAEMFAAGLSICKSEILGDPQSWVSRLPKA